MTNAAETCPALRDKVGIFCLKNTYFEFPPLHWTISRLFSHQEAAISTFPCPNKSFAYIPSPSCSALPQHSSTAASTVARQEIWWFFAALLLVLIKAASSGGWELQAALQTEGMGYSAPSISVTPNLFSWEQGKPQGPVLGHEHLLRDLSPTLSVPSEPRK